MKINANWSDWSTTETSKFVRVRDLLGLPFGSFGSLTGSGMEVERLKPNGKWHTTIAFGDRSHPTIHTSGRTLCGEIAKVEDFVQLFRLGWPACCNGCHLALVRFDRAAWQWVWSGWKSDEVGCWIHERWEQDSYCLASDQRLLANGSIVQMVPATKNYHLPASDLSRRASLPDNMKLREWDQ